MANLRAENPEWDFDAVRAAARQAWNDVLGKVRVTGVDPTVFYTAVYHTFLHPTLFSDVDGRYRGFDDQVHQVEPGRAHYHNIPGWDQYRSLIQWRAMIDPDRAMKKLPPSSMNRSETIYLCVVDRDRNARDSITVLEEAIQESA